MKHTASKGTSTRNTPRTEEAATPETTRRTLVELDAMAAKHPPLVAIDHQVFAAQYTDEHCEALGRSTRSRGVLKDAIDLLRVLHPAAGARAHGDLGLATTTLPLLVHWTRQLALAVVPVTGGTTKHTAELDAKRDAAHECHRRVRTSVEEALGRNDAWKARFHEKLDGDAHGEFDAEAARLYRLADALAHCFDAGDPVLTHALKSRGLSAATVTQCRADADAVEAARRDVQGTLGAGRDTPATNVTEGRVLVLMTDVFRAVERARKDKRATLVLRAGAATKRLVQPERTKAKAKPVEGAASDGATQTTPAARTTKTKRGR